jgi:predicted short-subunit dehydrogenase-like oxidoreductase (DUF2520 family)
MYFIANLCEYFTQQIYSMQVVIIGSGNVATILGRLFIKNNHTVLQVMSRNLAHAEVLGKELGCSFTNFEGKTNLDADLYLVSLTDNILFDLNKSFNLGNKLIVHTAGSITKDVLSTISTNYGVFYPFQSLRKENTTLPQIPFLVDANTEEATQKLEELAKTLSGIVKRTTDDERIKLHVSGVMVSNFTNHLYSLAEDFCVKEGVDFSLLYPLIKETADRITSHSPQKMQTGPAIRNDVYTLDKHLKVLATHPKLKYIYLKLTDSIINWKTP